MRTIIALLGGLAAAMLTYWVGLLLIAPPGGSLIKVGAAAGLTAVSVVPAMIVYGTVLGKPATAAPSRQLPR